MAVAFGCLGKLTLQPKCIARGHIDVDTYLLDAHLLDITLIQGSFIHMNSDAQSSRQLYSAHFFDTVQH